MDETVSDNRSLETIAVGYAVTLAVVAVSLAAGTHLFALSVLPEGPADRGWPGAAATGLLVASAVMIRFRPVIAGLLASLAGLVYVAANLGDDDLPMMVWAMLIGILIWLTRKLEQERRAAATRAAIHNRIDEELVDLSRAV